MYDSCEKPVGNAVNVGINKHGNEACERDRSAVLQGRNLCIRQSERKGNANARRRDMLCVVSAFAFDTDKRDHAEQQHDGADRDPHHHVGDVLTYVKENG